MHEWLIEEPLVGLAVASITLCFIATVYKVNTYIHSKKKQRLHKWPRPQFKASDPDVVIVGGGLTGATLAAALGADGRKVVVIEKDMSSTSLSYRGEGLTSGGVLALEELGLKHLMETFPNTSLDGYDQRDDNVDIEVLAPQSVSGYTFRHSLFVNALRKQARSEGVTFIHGAGKETVKENGRVIGVRYKEKDSNEIKTIRAPLTVICDGYYSSLRKQFSTLPKPSFVSTFFGIELQNVDKKKGKEWANMHFGNPNGMVYLTYSIGGNDHRLLVQINGDPPKDTKSFLRDTFAPKCPEYIKIPMLEALSKRDFTTVQVKEQSGDLTGTPPGVLIIGDALNTRDPVTASGMTVALRDILFWRKALRELDLPDDDELVKQKIFFKRERHNWAWSLNTMAHVMSTLGFNTDVASLKMRGQFMRTLQDLQSEPEVLLAVTDIMSGVNTDPTVLKDTLETTRKESIRHAFKTRPWTGVLSAIHEAVAIHFKFNEICGPALKEYYAMHK